MPALLLCNRVLVPCPLLFQYWHLFLLAPRPSIHRMAPLQHHPASPLQAHVSPRCLLATHQQVLGILLLLVGCTPLQVRTSHQPRLAIRRQALTCRQLLLGSLLQVQDTPQLHRDSRLQVLGQLLSRQRLLFFLQQHRCTRQFRPGSRLQVRATFLPVQLSSLTLRKKLETTV